VRTTKSLPKDRDFVWLRVFLEQVQPFLSDTLQLHGNIVTLMCNNDRMRQDPRHGESIFIQKGIHAMSFSPTERGQGLVEYAIILSFVAIVVIAVMNLLGPTVGNTFSSMVNSIP
jgi:pilus assembly protein Flp/PilA